MTLERRLAGIRMGSLVGITMALLLVCLASSVPARAQTDAYSVEVAVADRGADEQQDAYMAAFRRILINNSGDKTLLNRDAIRDGLKRAEDYVSGFSYRTPPPGTIIASDTPITEAVRRTGAATQLMMVSFDRQLVRQLIDESAPRNSSSQDSEPVATLLRSDSALVWLLIQDDGRDIMISDPAAINVQSRAREIAGAAGISLVFPAGDEEDRAAVSIDDMIARDLDRIAAASVRYEQDTVLIGRLERNGARGWRGQWVRLIADTLQEDSFETPSLDEALQSGLALLSTEGSLDQSYRYGGDAISDTEGLVWVGSVNSLGDYAAVMGFLQGLPAVRTVYPKEVDDTAMVVAVMPRSALSDIETALVTQNRLRRTVPPVTDLPGSLSRNADLALEFGR